MGVELFLLQVLGLLVLCLFSGPVEDEVGDIVGAFLAEGDCDILVDPFRGSCDYANITDVVDEDGEKRKRIDGDDQDVVIIQRDSGLRHLLALHQVAAVILQGNIVRHIKNILYL